MIKLYEWQWPYICDECNTMIWSKVAGQLVYCQCGLSAVDQTPYYTRRIGSTKFRTASPEELEANNIVIIN